MGKMKLFDDDGSGDDTAVNEIKINNEFARRFEHNSKREALQRYEELKKSGAISDSGSDEYSSSESEVEDIPKKKEVEFFDVLSKIKNKDPVLKNGDIKLFESESEDEKSGGDGGKRKEKKKKPKYLAQVIAEQLIKYGPEYVGSDDDGDDVPKNKVKSYDEEQQELIKAVLDATNEAEKEDDGDELLKEKIKEDAKDENDEEEQERIRKIDEAIGVENLDEGTMFLKDYFRNRMWVGKGGVNGGELDEEDVDEEEVERQEAYERDFNFRFEENAGNRVMGHSRFVEGSVRKKDNKRKEEKERQKMRRDKIKSEMKEELKYLKNLKKKEILEKIQKIREVAGIGEDGECLLDVSDLEEDFDPQAYDKKMSKAFNDEYYEAEDPQLGSDGDEDDEEDIEKPDFDKEDKLLGLPNDWDEFYESGSGFHPDSKDKFDEKDNFLGAPNERDEVNKSGGGFMEARQKVLKLKAEKGVDNGVEAEALVKEVRDKCMEEYYGLEYEDLVGGDVKTRFRYRPVKPKRFGLSDTEILVADNKLLNQLVPLKKIAPYRDQEWKVPRPKVLQVRKQIREIPKRKLSDAIKSGNEFRGTGEKRKSVAENNEGPPDKEVNGDTSNLSRRAKRRRVQSGLKLSHERLLAYGKIPSKPKSRKK